MQERDLGRTGRTVSSIGLGTWQLGSDWGEVGPVAATEILATAVESGVTFIDTADVYGDGRSERLIGQFLHTEPNNRLVIATKMGRRVEQDPANYTLANFQAWTDRSRRNLGVDVLDLVQLHCPPDQVYCSERVFDALELLVAQERIRAYGVSVETAAQALSAITRPGISSVQIIFNPLRLKPLDQVFPAARAAGVGIIARVPLASGLLSGRFDENTVFAENDHRCYNRTGAAFDVGETFSGVDFAVGLAAVRRLAPLVPEGMTLAQFALRWVIDHAAVTTVIPGATSPAQAADNAAVERLPRLSDEIHDAVVRIYDELIRPEVHHRW